MLTGGVLLHLRAPPCVCLFVSLLAFTYKQTNMMCDYEHCARWNSEWMQQQAAVNKNGKWVLQVSMRDNSQCVFKFE